MARFGRIDTWVNNAAVSVYATVEQMEPAEMERLVQVNLLGAMYGSRVAVRHMRPAGQGTIINVGSALSDRAVPLQSAYVASKHGLAGFSHSLLREVPYEYADSRGRLLHIGKSYYDSLDLNNGAMTPFADDCERRENGFQTARNPMTRVQAGNGQTDPAFAYLGGLGCEAQMNTNMWEYIDTIDNRRVEIADPVTGLVWGMSHFRHDMKEPSYKLINVPFATERVIRASTGAGFDLPAIHIYKIWGGQMHEIEAMGFVIPYMSPTGWED